MDERLKLLVANAISAILALIVGLWTGHSSGKLSAVHDDLNRLQKTVAAQLVACENPLASSLVTGGVFLHENPGDSVRRVSILPQ
jgi:hypothetical protein